MRSLLAFSTSVLAALSSIRAAPQITDLGDLPGNIDNSEGLGLSANGSVAVGYSWSNYGVQAYRWTNADNMSPMGFSPFAYEYLTSPASQGIAASSDGSVIVGSSSAWTGEGVEFGTGAFRWTSAGGMVNLGDVSGGSYYSVAYDVSSDGAIVVGYATNEVGPTPFRWTEAGGIVSLGGVGIARAISSNGAVIVGEKSNEAGFGYVPQAFRWTQAGGLAVLGDLPGGQVRSEAHGVNADGTVIVGVSESANGQEAFRWTASGGIVGLGDLAGGSFESIAKDTSGDGQLVVGTSSSSAFIWDSYNGIRNLQTVLADAGLNLAGWQLTSAEAISEDGTTIVGSGINNNGKFHGWIITGFDWSTPVAKAAFRGSTTDFDSDGLVTITLDGLESHDPSGIVTYAWSWAGGSASGASTTATLPIGTTTITLTVTDGNGKTDIDTLTIETVTNQLRYQNLGVLDLPGGGSGIGASSSDSVYSNGMSADGSTIVGFANSTNGWEAFRWTQDGGVQGLGDLAGGAFSSIAYRSNHNGSSIFGISDDGAYKLFKWTQAGGMQNLGIGADLSCVSDDGSTLLYFTGTSGAGTRRDYLWTQAGGSVELTDSSNYTKFNALSADGTIIAGTTYNFVPRPSWGQAYRQVLGGSMQSLGQLPNQAPGGMTVVDMSPDGSYILGTYSDSSSERAFRWSQENGLQDLGAFQPQAITADGFQVLGRSNSSPYLPVVWDEINGLRDLKTVLTAAGLNLSEWTSSTSPTSFGMSNDGSVIAGTLVRYGTRTGYNQTWRITNFGPPSYTITFLPGTHGSVAGANQGANYSVTRRGGQTFPTASITANPGYTFIGWGRPLPSSVDGDFVATAQYYQGDDDLDGDGLLVSQEYAAGTDWTKADTDGDKLDDGIEIALGLNSTVASPNAEAALVAFLQRNTAIQQAADLYTETAIRNVRVNAPHIQANPATGEVTLNIQLEVSDQLSPGSWQPLTTFQHIEPSQNAAFFRVVVEE